MPQTDNEASVLTPHALLEHWQGHRRVTRRVIEVFPDDKLFSFSVGSMRPFSKMVQEFLRLAEPIARGVATGEWVTREDRDLPKTKAGLLTLWDETTVALTVIFGAMQIDRFSAVDKAFGQWEGRGIDQILYAIDNEIHHRGQGYVYLRALGIEPPAFYDRS